MKPYLSIIIPCYNEETNIRLGALAQVSRFLEHQTFTWEVLIIDDGSTDASPTLLDEFAKVNGGFRVIHNTHLGKAGTVATGVEHSSGSIILFTDLDQATPIKELTNVLLWFGRGYDVVIGSRNTHREGAPFLRILMARGFIVLRSVILGLRGIVDTQCGFKAFSRKAAKDIFSGLKVYGTKNTVSGSMVTAGFDIEVIFLAKQKGYRIKEVPVEWHYVETRRVSPVKDSWHGLVDIFRIRINAWRGYYK